MPMRAPDGAEAQAEREVAAQGIPDDDPVLLAFRSARVVDEPIHEGELEAIREWEETGVEYDAATVSAEIAARAAQDA